MRLLMPAATKRILILGGTHEGATLAQAARDNLAGSVEIIYSLAGRLTSSPSPDGALRVGGFGGASGLQRYLDAAHIDAVVDATHPYATRMSHHAAMACAAAGIARLMLKRPPWRPTKEDLWVEAASPRHAAGIVLTLGRRVFLTTGRGTLHDFADLPDVWFLVRLMEQPTASLPLHRYEIVLGRPPFPIESERQLMGDRGVDLLVTKNSGGITETKLTAARQLRLPVVMVRRPPLPDGAIVTSVEAAVAWLDATLSLRKHAGT